MKRFKNLVGKPRIDVMLGFSRNASFMLVHYSAAPDYHVTFQVSISEKSVVVAVGRPC